MRWHHKGSPQSLLRFADGSLGVDPELGREQFFTGCDEASTAWAVRQLVPQEAPFPDPADRPTVVAWRQKPSTYAICAKDRAVSPDLQRVMALRAGERVTWPSGHSPFLSHPDVVADLLEPIARGHGATTKQESRSAARERGEDARWSR